MIKILKNILITLAIEMIVSMIIFNFSPFDKGAIVNALLFVVFFAFFSLLSFITFILLFVLIVIFKYKNDLNIFFVFLIQILMICFFVLQGNGYLKPVIFICTPVFFILQFFFIYRKLKV